MMVVEGIVAKFADLWVVSCSFCEGEADHNEVWLRDDRNFRVKKTSANKMDAILHRGSILISTWYASVWDFRRIKAVPLIGDV